MKLIFIFFISGISALSQAYDVLPLEPESCLDLFNTRLSPEQVEANTLIRLESIITLSNQDLDVGPFSKAAKSQPLHIRRLRLLKQYQHLRTTPLKIDYSSLRLYGRAERERYNLPFRPLDILNEAREVFPGLNGFNVLIFANGEHPATIKQYRELPKDPALMQDYLSAQFQFLKSKKFDLSPSGLRFSNLSPTSIRQSSWLDRQEMGIPFSPASFYKHVCKLYRGRGGYRAFLLNEGEDPSQYFRNEADDSLD